MKILLPLYCLMFSFLLVTCHKKDPISYVLPEATQQGKNTVGFIVNGEVWRPYHKCSWSSTCEEIESEYLTYGAGKYLGLSFTRMRNGKLSFLQISTPFATINDPGNKIDSVGITYAGEGFYGNIGIYSLIRPGSNFIITKLDTVNKIISGTFDFILSEDNNGQTIELKQGRFDVTFNTCICSN